MKNHCLLLLGLVISVPLIPLCAQKAFDLDDSTVALWEFSEGEGTVLHDSGPLGIDLRSLGVDVQYVPLTGEKPKEIPPEWVRGKFGKALLFNAGLRQAYGKTTSPSKLGLDKEMTFEAWVRPEEQAVPADLSIFQNAEYGKAGFRVALMRDFKVVFMLEDGTNEIPISGKTQLAPGEWSHIACTYDGVIAKIYINGWLDGQKEVPNAVIQSKNSEYVIGIAGGIPYFNGAIEGIRISKVARTEFKIKKEPPGNKESIPESKAK